MSEPTRRKSAVVLVLGDLGRSPRMQYHALSLAEQFARVHLIGFSGERCVPAVEAAANIEQVRLEADLLPRPRARVLYLLYAPAKALAQLLQLLYILLLVLPRADVTLVQTPPAIPALAALWLTRLLRGGALVIDWHNLGFSVLRHGLGRANHPFVRLSYLYERTFGRLANGHLCVTHAMARWLRSEWGLDARVLYDRPPVFFRRLELVERHALLRRLAPQLVDARGTPLWPREAGHSSGDGGGGDGEASPSPWASEGTPWTLWRDGRLVERPAAPRLVVSSTSWTADEDFGLLLDALARLDARLLAESAESAAGEGGGAAAPPPPPRVVVAITGKGPLKAHYEHYLREHPLRTVAVCTMWLEPEDYPRLLGSADLGVCMHTSTSGLDLPMKVLDMFGCGLPVCAVDFECLRELVTHRENGYVFRTRDEVRRTMARPYHLWVPHPRPCHHSWPTATPRVGSYHQIRAPYPHSSRNSCMRSSPRRPRRAARWTGCALVPPRPRHAVPDGKRTGGWPPGRS